MLWKCPLKFAHFEKIVPLAFSFHDNSPSHLHNLISLILLGNCLFSFSTEKITGKKTYTEDLETKISTTFGAFGGKFGASVGYHHIEDNTEHYQNIFTETEASCCVYTAELYEFAHPKFHNNFIQGLNSLTEEYVTSIYYR